MKSHSVSAIKCVMLVGLIGGCLQCSMPEAAGQTAGTILLILNSGQSNSLTNCYLAADGWDKFVVVTNIFIGPNYSFPIPAGGIPNTNHWPNLILDDCSASNGTNLVSEIVIQNNVHPNDGETTCGTNDSSCSSGTNASTATIKMSTASDACYRVKVVYKSSSTNGVTNITANWSYSHP